MRRISPSGRRAAERRERENECKRLSEVFPELEKLTLRIIEGKPGSVEPEVAHTRYIVINRAPAMFDLPCSNRRCDGGHDVTNVVMHALRGRTAHFEGDHTCEGLSDEGSCNLELHFEADASYTA